MWGPLLATLGICWPPFEKKWVVVQAVIEIYLASTLASLPPPPPHFAYPPSPLCRSCHLRCLIYGSA